MKYFFVGWLLSLGSSLWLSGKGEKYQIIEDWGTKGASGHHLSSHFIEEGTARPTFCWTTVKWLFQHHRDRQSESRDKRKPSTPPPLSRVPSHWRTERRECSEMSVMLVSPFLLTPWLPLTVILHVLAFSVLYRPTKMSVPSSFLLYLSAMKMDKVAVLTEFVAKAFSQNHCPLSCPVTLG